MRLYNLNPLSDSRWDDLAATHPKASVFHQKSWLQALAKTYGYRPVAITTTPPGRPLTDAILFCEVRSWITGNRLVSLPFTDHAEPLYDGDIPVAEIVMWAREQMSQRKLKYIELRPISGDERLAQPIVQTQSFWLHTLDLTSPIEKIFDNLHKSCMQRRIRHAARQQLVYERGRSEPLVDDFYRLVIMNRRYLRLLPQPQAWFRNLIACHPSSAEIRMARKNGTAVAAILTLRHRGTTVYKYGCSDEKFRHLGAMPFLFGKLIEESKAEDVSEIDLGRTELGNNGLITFKDRLGAARRQIHYFRYAENCRHTVAMKSDSPIARALFASLPDALSSAAGRMMYRHIA